jgi:hypothetical protein
MTVLNVFYATYIVLQSLIFIYGPILLQSFPPFLTLTGLDVQMISDPLGDMLYNLDLT